MHLLRYGNIIVTLKSRRKRRRAPEWPCVYRKPGVYRVYVSRGWRETADRLWLFSHFETGRHGV